MTAASKMDKNFICEYESLRGECRRPAVVEYRRIDTDDPDEIELYGSYRCERHPIHLPGYEEIKLEKTDGY